MQKVLISLPDQLAIRMRATIPSRQRSKVFTHLIEEEIEKRERALYECAVAVEQDMALHQEMDEWNVTINDGLTDASEKKPISKKNNNGIRKS